MSHIYKCVWRLRTHKNHARNMFGFNFSVLSSFIALSSFECNASAGNITCKISLLGILYWAAIKCPVQSVGSTYSKDMPIVTRVGYSILFDYFSSFKSNRLRNAMINSVINLNVCDGQRLTRELNLIKEEYCMHSFRNYAPAEQLRHK